MLEITQSPLIDGVSTRRQGRNNARMHCVHSTQYTMGDADGREKIAERARAGFRHFLINKLLLELQSFM